MGCKKKLYKVGPNQEPTREVERHVSRKFTRREVVTPQSIEREIRQALADKVSGNLAGVWLLVAEHLRLGTWDLLCGWTRCSSADVEPRLAMQLVHEAAVCTRGIRANRTLHGRAGFELANGLPFVATDEAMHQLLDAHTIEDSQRLQVALGKIRFAEGHFLGRLLAIDPHRVASFSKRRMRERVENRFTAASKKSQTFWVLDADTKQPLCFTTTTASQDASTATPDLLRIANAIFPSTHAKPLIVADSEHFSIELVDNIRQTTDFHLLTPIPQRKAFQQRFRDLPADQFTPRWAGFATAKLPHVQSNGEGGNYWQFVERYGERPCDYQYKGFLSTIDSDEVAALTQDFPKRWHIEEFFNANQALGWKRSGTLNLNVRYGQMTMALLAQAAIHQLRKRLGEPYSTWDATHLAKDLFFKLDGDVRVTGDTIVVTFYNAPNDLQSHYCDLPEKLIQEQIAPGIPWLYNYRLDFRFK